MIHFPNIPLSNDPFPEPILKFPFNKLSISPIFH